MNYRYDVDLEFLQHLNSYNLGNLVKILIYDRNGKKRITEELSRSKKFKKYYPNHIMYWKEITAEIQKFGGNTIINIFRGNKGVLYREILIDVCKRLKVNFNKDSKTEKIELSLLMKILEDALKEMSPNELKDLAIAFGLENKENIKDYTPEILMGLFQAIFKYGGFKSYQLTVIIVNAVLKAIIGRGLSLSANAALTKIMSILTGPIGWVVTGLWTIFDIAGPAYRVTIPAVIQIIELRQRYLLNKSGLSLDCCPS